MKNKYIFLFFITLLSCSKENLSNNSVIDSNIIKRQYTELDTYITNEFINPYGISV